MLTITPEASHALRGIIEASDAPDDAVVRISPQGANGTGPGPGLTIELIDSPPPDDKIVEGEEIEVSVEPTVAEILDDKQLEATVVGEQINFSIADQ